MINMSSEIKLVYRKKDGEETIFAEKSLYENLKDYDAKKYKFLIDRILDRNYYDSFDEYLYILLSIERILDGYNFEVYPVGRAKKKIYKTDLNYLKSFEKLE